MISPVMPLKVLTRMLIAFMSVEGGDVTKLVST